MYKKLVFSLLIFFFQLSHAQSEQAYLSVWVNEAIVSAYTYDYKTYLDDQKKIAKYFTADAWMAYSKALNESTIPDSVQKNRYAVSSVATEPPVITVIDPSHWKASMKLLVVYQNLEYKQRQNLNVTIKFTTAPSGQGVRGYTITNFQSITASPPCQCSVNEENNSSTNTTPNNAKQ